MSSEPARARVLAVDDVAVFRRTICMLLQSNRRLELVGDADCGERALAMIDDCEPDFVIMDLRMPGMGGIAATRAIKARRPSTVVALISTTHPSELASEAATCGADAIVWKPELRPGVLEAIWLRNRAPETG